MVKGKSHWAPIRAASGFTVIELMVVVVIAAVLMGIAVPALQNLVAANQLTTLTDGFATALNEARSEAAKLGVPVAMTAASGTNWSLGWTTSVSGAGRPLRNGAQLPSGYTLNPNGSFANGVTFDSTGRLLPGTLAGEFMFCQGGGPSSGGKALMIMVAPSGRVRIAQNDSSGNPIDTTQSPAVSVTTCTP
jgi:type IV fimbrial biogenesis protein FimT